MLTILLIEINKLNYRIKTSFLMKTKSLSSYAGNSVSYQMYKAN